MGTSLALPLGAGVSGIVEAFAKRLTSPQTPPRRAFWGNDQVGTNTGTFIARSPKRRGAAGLVSFSLSLGNANARPRRERDNPTASQPDSLARLAYALRNRFFNRYSLLRARGEYPPIAKQLPEGAATRGGVGVERVSPPDSPTIIMCPFAANPVVASAPTLRLQTELPTPRCLRPS